MPSTSYPWSSFPHDMEDIFFFLTHLLFPVPFFLKIHKQHHEYDPTFTFVSEYADPIEYSTSSAYLKGSWKTSWIVASINLFLQTGGCVCWVWFILLLVFYRTGKVWSPDRYMTSWISPSFESQHEGMRNRSRGWKASRVWSWYPNRIFLRWYFNVSIFTLSTHFLYQTDLA